MRLHDFSVSFLKHFVRSIELQWKAGDRKQCRWWGILHNIQVHSGSGMLPTGGVDELVVGWSVR